jgi:hypothetical protein
MKRVLPCFAFAGATAAFGANETVAFRALLDDPPFAGTFGSTARNRGTRIGAIKAGVSPRGGPKGFWQVQNGTAPEPASVVISLNCGLAPQVPVEYDSQ